MASKTDILRQLYKLLDDINHREHMTKLDITKRLNRIINDI